MIGLSIQLHRRIVPIFCSILGVGALIWGVCGLMSREDVAVNLSEGATVTKNFTAQTSEQRLAFIAQFGWEVEAEPLEIQEVLIPAEFDDVYASYNELQKAQGLNLTRYAGKIAKRYCYKVLNYPDCEDEVRLNLLIAEKKVIGGDVCSLSLDGFMHGFRRAAPEENG